jgi:ectoine hydroxylase-related dioxygenase (phytanoyl-CoA dioxygenase family)
VPLEPTPEQIERYRADGFLVVTGWLGDAEVERVRDRFERAFVHEWETGLRPDEVNYEPGVTPPDRTRQLCNTWKSDRVLAHTVLQEQNGRWAARLAGEPGMRLLHDNLVWKPPSGKALLAHRDAAYTEFLEPPNMTTCWMALDDTDRDTGTIYYVRGSNTWEHQPAGGQFHAPDDWLGHMREVAPNDDWELVPIEVPAGGAAFHDGWCFHGSPPNERADAQRRSIISHMVTTRSTWHPAERHPIYSKYMRVGSLEMSDDYFPVLWSEDRRRTTWIDAYCGEAALLDAALV